MTLHTAPSPDPAPSSDPSPPGPSRYVALAWRATAALLLLGALAATVARTVRYPNQFATIHWLIDYRLGFIRRAFAGSVLSGWSWLSGEPITLGLVNGVSIAVYAILWATLLALVWRLLARRGYDQNGFLFAAVFLTSPYIVMTGHLMGYLDALMILAALGAIGCIGRGMFISGGLLAAAGILVHETFLLVGLPAAVMATALYWRRSKRHALVKLVPLLLPLAALTALMINQTRLDRSVQYFIMVKQLRGYAFVDPGWAASVSEWLHRTIGEWMRIEAKNSFDRLSDPVLLMAVLPGLATLLWFGFSHARIAAGSRAWLLTLGVTVAPLTLHLIAWDRERVWTYALAAAFMAVLILDRQADPAPRRRPASEAKPSLLPLLAIPTLAYQCFSSLTLMDGLKERFDSPQRAALYGPLLLAALLVMLAEGRRPSREASAADRRPPTDSGAVRDSTPEETPSAPAEP